MPTNYRLPLKHFEKKTWKDNANYNQNLFQIKFWPILSVIILLLLGSTTLVLFIQKNSSKVKNLVLTKSSNENQIFIGDCLMNLKEEKNSFTWIANNCLNNLEIEVSSEAKKDYTKINNEPNYYIKLNQSNLALINHQVLFTNLINKDSNYINKKLIQLPNSNSKLGLYGECTLNKQCKLVNIENNKLKFINHELLKDFIKDPDLKEIQLLEEQGKNYIEVITDTIKKYLVDLNQKQLNEI
jgi:hypothetical protein